MVADGLQQQVDEHSQLLGLAARQEAQDDGGPGGGGGLPLELAARLAAQAAKQDPESHKQAQGWSLVQIMKYSIMYFYTPHGRVRHECVLGLNT